MKERKTISELKFREFTHEIKNPLTISKGYLEMILKNKEMISQENLEKILEEINRCLLLIDDFSKNQFIELEKEELDIGYLLEEVQSTFQSIYPQKNHTIILDAEDEYYIQGDYYKLKQVFINLIKNAYEACMKSITIIHIKIQEQKKEYKIEISDNGIGMTKEELKNIERPYYTTKKEGTGLGVPFCKEIILKHGGTLSYQSEKNYGTITTITLPKSN